MDTSLQDVRGATGRSEAYRNLDTSLQDARGATEHIITGRSKRLEEEDNKVKVGDGDCNFVKNIYFLHFFAFLFAGMKKK